MMEREDFIVKINELIPTPDDGATRIWIDWAGEIAESYDRHLDESEYVRGSDPGSSYAFFENRTAAEANLQELHAAFYEVNQKYGGDIAGLLYLQALKRCCMYPHEFMLAAEYLRKGGSVDELGRRTLDGEFNDIDSQTSELRSAPIEARDMPLLS